MKKKVRGHPGSNRRPLDLQSNALPLSYIPVGLMLWHFSELPVSNSTVVSWLCYKFMFTTAQWRYVLTTHSVSFICGFVQSERHRAITLSPLYEPVNSKGSFLCTTSRDTQESRYHCFCDTSCGVLAGLIL